MPPVAIRSDTISDSELVEKVRQFTGDADFLSLHHHSLLEKFPEQWVAVYKKAVVSHGTNINAVRRQLTAKKIPLNRVAIAFLTTKPKTLIL